MSDIAKLDRVIEKSTTAIVRHALEISRLRTALRQIAQFEPQAGRDHGQETNFATAVEIARAALEDKESDNA